MKYYVLGKEVEIISMKKPAIPQGAIFEVIGSKSLEEIGLKEKFYFLSPLGFCLKDECPESYLEMEEGTLHQQLLGLFLQKSILKGELVSQFYF